MFTASTLFTTADSTATQITDAAFTAVTKFHSGSAHHNTALLLVTVLVHGQSGIAVVHSGRGCGCEVCSQPGGNGVIHNGCGCGVCSQPRRGSCVHSGCVDLRAPPT
eukprot:6175845-Pleurochrysis_carterae.AAC.2